jgi:hypothetical protein
VDQEQLLAGVRQAGTTHGVFQARQHVVYVRLRARGEAQVADAAIGSVHGLFPLRS